MYFISFNGRAKENPGRSPARGLKSVKARRF